MKSWLMSGVALGLSAGLSPGPMLTLVITQTLKHGVREGFKVAMAPLVTDIPIVVVSLSFLALFSKMNAVLGVISILGGCYLLHLGISGVRFQETDLGEVELKPHSLQKGLLVNFFNPSPYLFWSTIGGPLVLKASETSLASAGIFIVSFYVLLVGSKMTVALGSGGSRNLLQSNHYRLVVRALGLVLIIFGVLFLRDGLHYLGVTGLKG